MAYPSPMGGTTSLPQYLQQRQEKPTAKAFGAGAAGTVPTLTPPKAPGTAPTPPAKTAVGSAAGAGAAGTTPAQPAPQPALPVGPVNQQTGNPTIPPAPPAAPPAPAAVPGGQVIQSQAPGATPTGTPPAFDFGQYLQQQLTGNKGRYDAPLIQSLMQQIDNNLNDTRQRESDAAIADAASRGVYHGTPLTNSLGDIGERFIRGQADAKTGLLRSIADAGAQDQQNNIGNMFTFGNGQLNQQQLQAYIYNLLAQQGAAGGPTIGGSINDIAGLPAPQGADYSGVYQLLGGVFAPRPPQAAGAK